MTLAEEPPHVAEGRLPNGGRAYVGGDLVPVVEEEALEREHVVAIRAIERGETVVSAHAPRQRLFDHPDGEAKRDAHVELDVLRGRQRRIESAHLGEHAPADERARRCEGGLSKDVLEDPSIDRQVGTHPLAAGYASVHYFGHGTPNATWRMAGPLAHFAKAVRSPDLILTVAEWVAFHPAGFEGPEDIRHAAATCTQKKTVIAGVDPVAIDAWAVRNLFTDVPSGNKKELLDLDDPSSMFSKFLRYYREVRGSGTLDASLVDVA